MKTLLSLIVNTFKYIGKTFSFVRNTVFNLLLLVLILLLISAFLPEKESAIMPGTILNMTISGNIVEERRPLSSLEKFFGSAMDAKPDPETLLQDIIDTIDTAAKDNNISILRLDLKNLTRGGLNQLLAIGKAINRFRLTGKKVIAAQDYYSQTQYYLASYADQIILNPMGVVDLHGFGNYRLYFKEAMEKLQVSYNVFKVGSYKSALEPFTRDDMSNEDRRQNRIWLSALWRIYTNDVSRQRSLKTDAIEKYTTDIAAQLLLTDGNAAELALKLGLVDQLLTRNQISTYFKAVTGTAINSVPQQISSRDYAGRVKHSYEDDNSSDAKVGVIIGEGNIVPGKQPAGLIGADSLVEMIRKSRRDDQIKAVVLRINSGGGSAFASEIIRQEILALKKSGKPIVVSMGSVTASGGYWLAANADQIWASPATITGSIGIFAAIPTFEKPLASLGIHRDGIGTTPLASGVDLTQPLPNQLKSAIQQNVTHGYNRFLSIVAEGRGLKRSHVEEIAQGRVFDGITAKSLGLVDNLGSLSDAVNAAAKLASLSDFQPVYIHRTLTVKDQLFQYITTNINEKTLLKVLKNENPLFQKLTSAIYSPLETLLQLRDPQNIYAYSFINPAL
jgi:protease-4